MTGDISFSGSAKLNTRSLLAASQVNKWKNIYVGSDTGSFATFAAPESAVTMATPWVFASSTPLPGLWSVGGFTFDLTSSAVVFRSRNVIDLQGTGTVSGHGFDATSGDWSITFTKHRRKRHFWFSFESNTPITQSPAVPVPESGSTGVLLTFAVIGLFCLRSQKNRAGFRTKLD